MWGLWGRTEGAGCGGAPELGAWRNGVKGQKEKRGRAWWPEVRCPECGGKREVGGGVVSALRLGEGRRTDRIPLIKHTYNLPLSPIPKCHCQQTYGA